MLCPAGFHSRFDAAERNGVLSLASNHLNINILFYEVRVLRVAAARFYLLVAHLLVNHLIDGQHAAARGSFDMAKSTYKDAGVDLELYRESMARLPRLLHRTYTPRVLSADGGFAGLFQLDFSNKLFARNYKEPVLVACTDGVGTKLKVAQAMDEHRTVGIDLVAMSVNDAICCGA